MPENKTKYEFGSIDIISKGDLKGYATGFIYFTYLRPTTGKVDEVGHEFLYRYDDEANGPNFKFQSIDWGKIIPGIDELWPELEEKMTKEVKELLKKQTA